MTRQDSSTTQPAGRITDARGRTVSQLDPVMMDLMRRQDVIPPDTLRLMARQIGVGMTRAHRLAFWAGVVSILCAGIALAILLTRLSAGSIRTRDVVRSMLPYCGIWVAPFAVWIGMRNVRHGRITKIMLEHLHCPHCGYDIRGLPADAEDGVTVCPECGCAWRLNRASANPSDMEEHGND